MEVILLKLANEYYSLNLQVYYYYPSNDLQKSIQSLQSIKPDDNSWQLADKHKTRLQALSLSGPVVCLILDFKFLEDNVAKLGSDAFVITLS